MTPVGSGGGTDCCRAVLKGRGTVLPVPVDPLFVAGHDASRRSGGGDGCCRAVLTGRGTVLPVPVDPVCCRP